MVLSRCGHMTTWSCHGVVTWSSSSKMAGEEDVELRDLVAQTLETRGVLGKIRAQLRASVFLALEEQDSQQKPHPLVSSKLQQYLKTKDGQMTTALVREFLNFFDLDYTCSVFDPETNALETCPGRNQLARDLGLDIPAPTSPLLDTILQRATSTVTTHPLSSSAGSLTSALRQPQHHEEEHQYSGGPQRDIFSTSPISQTQPDKNISSTGIANTTPFDSFSSGHNTRSKTGGASDGVPPPNLSPPPEPNRSSHLSSQGKGADPSLNDASNTNGIDIKSGKQGQGSGHSPTSEEKLFNGGGLDDDLEDFFNKMSTKVNLREQDFGRLDTKESYHDDFHSDPSVEQLYDRSQVQLNSKFDETEDITISQTSLTADFDYTEKANN